MAMATTDPLPPRSVISPFNMRLRGASPRIETAASNLAIVMAAAAASEFSLVKGGRPCFLVTATESGTALSVTRSNSALSNEPFISLGTTSGRERLRVDSNGVTCDNFKCDTIYAGSYQNLVDQYDTYDANKPPTARALTQAYETLSNMVSFSANSITSSNVVFDGENATFLGETVFYNPATFVSMVDVSSNSLFRGDLTVLGSLNAQNVNVSYSNVTVYSSQEIRSNLTVEGTIDTSNVHTYAVIGKSSSPESVQSLKLVARDDLSVTASNVHITSDTVGFGPQQLVRLRYLDSNMGINLPDGVDPICTLHVNGTLMSTEEQFALSDASVKTGFAPLDNVLDRLCKINGCTYLRKDEQNGVRHLGVIAQEVAQAFPEAVCVGKDGRMSVAYGNLVAAVIEGVKQLWQLQQQNSKRLKGLRRLLVRKHRIRKQHRLSGVVGIRRRQAAGYSSSRTEEDEQPKKQCSSRG